MYLSDSNVWTYRGDESLKLTLVDVVSDHQNFVDRAETILVAEQFELPQSLNEIVCVPSSASILIVWI
jgi:hypothetical protein